MELLQKNRKGIIESLRKCKSLIYDEFKEKD